MAKIQFGVRVQPELKELVENEAKEKDISKADIVEEMIRLRYNNRETIDNETETEQATDAVAVDYIGHLKEQIEKKDTRIEDLERINNNYAAKILEPQTLIESPASSSRWDRFKDVFR